MLATREEGKWVRCPSCGHKLFKLISKNPVCLEVSILQMIDGMPDVNSADSLEIKCHSCKKIVKIEI